MKYINENYFKNNNPNNSMTQIKDILDEGEQVLWQGKPKKRAYVFSAITKMLPIALIWLLFDGGIIIAMLSGAMEIPPEMIIVMVVFFAFHLLPVWIWLSNIITASKRHKNLEYAFTNKRIIIKSGIIGIDFQSVYYSDITAVNLKVGFTDKMFKVGDIYISSMGGAKVLFDIEDPYFISQKLQQIVVDIKTDIEYPNDLRPDENHGYRTVYKSYNK